MEKIKKVTAEVKAAIKRKSAYTLPNNPTDSGYKANDIRKAFWQPIIDVTNSALGEVDRVVEEANVYLNELKNIDKIAEVAGNYYHSCIGLICTLTDEGFVVSGYKGDETSLVIPTHIYCDGKYVKVVEIAEGAFSNKAIESVEIPETVLKAGDGAFSSCDNLSTVVFNGALSLGSSVFNASKYVRYVVPRECFENYKILLASYCTEFQILVKETIQGNRQSIEELQSMGAGLAVELAGAKQDINANEELIVRLGGDVVAQGAKGDELSAQVSGMDIAMTRFAENTLPQMENRIEAVEEGLLTAESDIEGLRRDMQNEAHFKGYVATNADFETMPGDVNDYAYSSEDGFIWVHNGTVWEKTDKEVPGGAVPLGNATPLVDGEASPGESTNAAREDHRHPTDETRASVQELTALSDKVNRLHGTVTPTVLTVEVVENTTVSFTAQQIGATFIDWGDGAVTTEFNDLPTHTYAKAGIYDIKIFDATVLAGAGLTSILGYAFTTLKRVVVGDSVISIGSYAFYNSPNLKYVTISDSVVSIGSAAFYECPNLAKVVIGSGISSIESNVFYHPPAILQLNAEIPPLITTSTFGQADDTLILVPHDSVEAYRSAENWTSLAHCITANAMLSDLDEFVKNTDIGGGLTFENDELKVYTHNTYGLNISSSGVLTTQPASQTDIDSKLSGFKPISPNRLEYAVLKALSDCKDTTLWTDDTTDENGEVVQGTKTKARELIGAVGNTDIASAVYNNSTGKYDGVPGLFQYDGGQTSGFFKSTAGGDGKDRFRIAKAKQSEIDNRTVSDYHDSGVSGPNHCKPIVPANLDYAVIAVLTNALIALTEDTTDEGGNVVKGGKSKACEWLGALKTSNAETIFDQVYVKAKNGAQSVFNISNDLVGSSIVQRTATNQIRVNDPISEFDCVNKQYLLNLPDKVTDETIKAKWRAWLGIE